MANSDGVVIGKVVQVAGPAVDCEFPEGQIPLIYTAIRIVSEGFETTQPIDIICEAQQHIGEGRVRTARQFQAWEGGGEYNVARGLRKCFNLRTSSSSKKRHLPRGTSFLVRPPK